MIELPYAWNFAPLASPPTIYRAWAGFFGANRGLTTLIGHDPDGRPIYANTDNQDVFRHSFVQAARYIDVYYERLGADPSIIDSSPSTILNSALAAANFNELYASNPLQQHLMDYWNNYEGALVAQEAIAIFGRNITNDQLADYVAAQVLQSAAEPPGAGRFIHDATLDSRATVAGFEEQRLPPENLSPDAIREAFAGHFGHCFVAGTMIDMWPTGSDILPDASGVYERAEVLAKVWQKPIEEITPSDWVVSFDEDGNLKPGKVTRTFVNQAKVILDFFGTGVTPGHAYYRADSKRAYKFEPLIDILRDDGVVQDSSGVLIRAATGVPVGDPHDRFVWAITGEKSEDGSGVKVKEKGRIRLGTRIISEDGRDFCVGDLIRAGNGIVSSEGLICVGDIQIPFHWAYGDLLPKPEDYILKRSGTTLDDIYKVAEWEGLRPNLPPPMVRDDGPVQPLSQSGLDLMPRNTPLAWCDERYAASSRPMLNRKKRRADGVSERQQAKARKQSVN